jgi:hypothetical protein
MMHYPFETMHEGLESVDLPRGGTMRFSTSFFMDMDLLRIKGTNWHRSECEIVNTVSPNVHRG